MLASTCPTRNQRGGTRCRRSTRWHRLCSPLPTAAQRPRLPGIPTLTSPMRQRHATLGTLVGTVLSVLGSATAQQVPTGFQVDRLVTTGLTAPNDFGLLPDGRVLIANRPGSVTVYNGTSTATVGTVPNVEVGSERGLLGICADPNFGQNGHLYVWYSHNQDAFMHLDRFTCTGDLANPNSTNLTFAAASRRAILANVPDSAFNHNGGSVMFGPDGMLYLSIGDDASSCQAQNVDTAQGVLLRMDVSGLPAGGSTTAPTLAQLDPGTNPLSATSTTIGRLVIGLGLRNPFRFNIDPMNGNVLIGDVGQNSWEECSEYVYNASALTLANFGWPWREGTASYSSCTGGQPSLVNPIVTISAGQNWRSVIGGPVYRHTGGQHALGAAYDGSYFYADYFAGEIRRLVRSGNTWVAAPAVPGQPNATNWCTGVVALTSLQIGPDGALWLLRHPSTYATSGGELIRIRPIGPVNDVVVVSGDRQIVAAGDAFPDQLVVRVRDPNGAPLAGGVVNFTASGPGTLTTTNPVIADGSGIARTSALASSTAGGALTVTASTPGGGASAGFALFVRKMSVVSAPTLVLLQVSNRTDAVPPNVPYLVLASAPGLPPFPTPIGPLCTDPFHPLSFALEDSLGLFGYVTLSGSGAIGTPALSKFYFVPAGALTGITLNFQAIGWDPLTGPFRTDCQQKTL